MLALGCDPAGKLEQALDRVVDVAARSAGAEREAEIAVVRVELDRRAHAQPAEEAGGAIAHLACRRGEIVVDRLCERGCETLLGRSAHEVAGRDEDVLLQRLLNGAEGQRGLAVAPRREQEHVLAAAQVAEQRLQLLLAIDEGVVVGEVSERERVFLIHDCIIHVAPRWIYKSVLYNCVC